MENDDDRRLAEGGTEPQGPIVVTPTFFDKLKRWLITSIFQTIPVDPSSMVFYGIRQLAIGPVQLEAIPCGDNWTLHDNLKVTWVDLDGDQEVEFLAGMETDLASIPRLLWRVIPPFRSIKRPAVFHDALYHYRPFLLAGDGVMRRVDRGKADKLLYVAMRAEKLTKEVANEVYLGVRIGGGAAWHKHDDEFAAIDAAAIIVREAAAAAEKAQQVMDPVSTTGDPTADNGVRTDGSDDHPA